MSIRRFFVDTEDIQVGKFVELPERESVHARDALRLEIGDEIVVFNGNSEYEAKIADISSDSVTVAITAVKENFEDRDWQLDIFLGAIKLPQFELAMQKLTELGVDNFIPLYTEYAQVHIENMEHKRERWQNILISAAKQSERTTLPNIKDPITFKTSAPTWLEYDVVLFFTVPRELYRQHLEIKHISKMSEEIKNAKKIAVIIGPEGGFSVSEHQIANDWHLSLVHLGKEILRAETASISAVSSVNYIKYSRD